MYTGGKRTQRILVLLVAILFVVLLIFIIRCSGKIKLDTEGVEIGHRPVVS